MKHKLIHDRRMCRLVLVNAHNVTVFSLGNNMQGAALKSENQIVPCSDGEKVTMQAVELPTFLDFVLNCKDTSAYMYRKGPGQYGIWSHKHLYFEFQSSEEKGESKL